VSPYNRDTLRALETEIKFVWFQASVAKWTRTALFWAITQQVGQTLTDISGQPVGPTFKGQEEFILEDGNDRLSRNVGKELSLLAA